MVLENNMEIRVSSYSPGDFRLQPAQYGNETGHVFSVETK